MSSLEIVILAAGQGKRMRSARPKVLHAVGGRPMLAHVLATARALAPSAIHVVYGHGGEQVRAAIPDGDVRWVHQAEQHGTGHALAQALPAVAGAARVLVLYGDVPLIRPETLRQLIASAGDGLGILTARLENPAGYGRIVRDPAGRVARIVEHKDAGAAERAIGEINTGFLTAPAGALKRWVGALRNHNAQGEYYLTDIIAMAAGEGRPIGSHTAADVAEVLGVNSPEELARVERHYQKDRAAEAMQQGVTLRDPARFDLRGTLKAGQDVIIDVNVVLEGKVELGDGVTIGPNNVIRDAVIGKGTLIQPNCVIEESTIGADCRIGPFARLRPGTVLADHVHIGNFVEVKNSQIAEGSKANHLAYVGDATVGTKVNIGAGAITANYDGANKHRTVIGDNVSVGANCVLVAPVTAGAGATIGAGSVISRDAPAGELTLTRADQRTVKGWKRPVKKK
jgi:bifunctional UDP-N-acetylglucosamine pyrophosphorylase/glucosamine-1-phosphate N-acetyltransferase